MNESQNIQFPCPSNNITKKFFLTINVTIKNYSKYEAVYPEPCLSSILAVFVKLFLNKKIMDTCWIHIVTYQTHISVGYASDQ